MPRPHRGRLKSKNTEKTWNLAFARLTITLNGNDVRFQNQKSGNGAVAVGLPHRNRSLFKNAHINKQKEKELIEDD